MKLFTRLSVSVVLASGLLLSAGAFADSKSLRPEVGEPLQAAQQAMQAKDYKTAQAKIGDAEKVGKLTTYESYIIARMKIAASIAAGDYNSAIPAYEQAMASPEFPENEKVANLGMLAKLYYGAKNFAKAADTLQRYRAAGGTDSLTLDLLPQTLYLSGQYAETEKELNAQIAQLEKSGQSPTEMQLQLLQSCAGKLNDTSGYVAALQLLVTYYPKDSYWADLLARVANKPGFSDRLTLDVYRLKLKLGTLSAAGDFVDATELAAQAGYPGEADTFIKTGYAKKALGVGAPNDVDRQKRLQDLVTKKIADDKATRAQDDAAAASQPTGDTLVAAGLNYVGYGEYDKGIQMIQQGIAKGGLKNPDEAKLHLGYAEVLGGRYDDAVKVLKTVEGNNGTRDMAGLWMLVARRH